MIRVPTYTADQVRSAERPLLEAGVPLMRRAASALSTVVREELANSAGSRVLVLAGSGDNGGDALYAAAELCATAQVDLLTVGRRVHEDALSTAIDAGARRVDLDAATAEGTAPALILDGILGIGASVESGLRGGARDAVSRLLATAASELSRVVAVDLPSGLDADTGAAAGPVLPASVTVTFGAVKAGLARGRGPELCGRIVLVDLGLGETLRGLPPAGEASVSRVVAG